MQRDILGHVGMRRGEAGQPRPGPDCSLKSWRSNMGEHDTTGPELTGRDHFVIAKALHVASQHLASLPPDEQPFSDMQDMRRLLAARYPELAEMFAMQDDLKAGMAEA